MLKRYNPKDLKRKSGDIKSALDNIIASLDDLAHGTEGDFVVLGDELQKIYSNASSLANRISENIQVFDVDNSEGVLSRINLYTKTSHSRTSQALNEVEKLRLSLYDVIRLLDKIFSNTDNLSNISMYLRVIGVHIGIECARKSNADSIFSVVASDTVNLAVNIKEINNMIINHTIAAKNIQTASYKNTKKKFEQLQILTKEAEQAASITFKNVAELVDKAVQALQRANTISLEITKEIGAVVMGIQFHDSLRQRIEHIMDALTDAISLFDRSKNEDNYVANNGESPLAHASAILKLQESQLGLLFHETEKIYQEQHQAFDRIIQGIAAFTDCVKDIGAAEQSSDDERDSLSMLTDTTKIIMNARAGSETLAGEIKQATEEAFQVTSRLTGYVEATSSISHQIHLNALNSIIQADKLGIDGKPLQVISQDMVAISLQVKTLVPIFMKLVGEIKELVRANYREKGEKQSSAEDMDFNPEKIYQSFHDFKNNSYNLLEEGKILGQEVAQEQKKLLFLRSIIDRINSYKILIHEVSESVRPLIGDGSQNSQLYSDELGQRYTMEQERTVHREVLTENKHTSLSTPVDDTLDDIFFTDDIVESPGVELYENKDMEIEGQPANNNGEVTTVPETAPELSSSKNISEDDKINKENSLGDNVELF